MIKAGDKITVKYSRHLSQTGCTVLANRVGVVTQVVEHNGQLQGVYADVFVMKRTRNYYIPLDSIDGPECVNRIQSINLLKNIII